MLIFTPFLYKKFERKKIRNFVLKKEKITKFCAFPQILLVNFKVHKPCYLWSWYNIIDRSTNGSVIYYISFYIVWFFLTQGTKSLRSSANTLQGALPNPETRRDLSYDWIQQQQHHLSYDAYHWVHQQLSLTFGTQQHGVILNETVHGIFTTSQ